MTALCFIIVLIVGFDLSWLWLLAFGLCVLIDHYNMW